MSIGPFPRSMDDFEEIGRRRQLALDGTPRSNAQEVVTYYAILLDGRREPVECVPTALARQLEKELNMANHALSEIYDSFDHEWKAPKFDKWALCGTMSRFRFLIEKAKRLLPYYA